jgi:maleate cis-trans isomerase
MIQGIWAAILIFLANFGDQKRKRAGRSFTLSNSDCRNAKWLGKGDMAIAEVSSETLYRLAREVDVRESDVLFIRCVNLHTIQIIERLETDLKKPVITSNQATMWHILRQANINDKIEGYGQLFL